MPSIQGSRPFDYLIEIDYQVETILGSPIPQEQPCVPPNPRTGDQIRTRKGKRKLLESTLTVLQKENHRVDKC
jgi:hypothetical protein